MTSSPNDNFHQIFKTHFQSAQAPAPPARPAVVEPATDTRLVAPRDREALRDWCKQWLDVRLPAKAVCAEHQTPLDYLEYVFFEKGEQDPLVWACRGGGKTLCGAIATLLDMLFKPGIDIRILGGSQAQSERMYEHLVRMVNARFRDQMIRSGRLSRMTKDGFTLANGSRVELLAQTEGSVRGARVQKVRCDEVDLFSEKVWEAVQLTTRSKPGSGGAATIRGSIEALSTMNGSDGVIAHLVRQGNRKIFRWCVWDVIEKCGDACQSCTLNKDCQGKAHDADGFVPVSDVRIMRGRVNDTTWAYEVLCDHKRATHARGKCEVRRY